MLFPMSYNIQFIRAYELGVETLDQFYWSDIIGYDYFISVVPIGDWAYF